MKKSDMHAEALKRLAKIQDTSLKTCLEDAVLACFIDKEVRAQAEEGLITYSNVEAHICDKLYCYRPRGAMLGIHEARRLLRAYRRGLTTRHPDVRRFFDLVDQITDEGGNAIGERWFSYDVDSDQMLFVADDEDIVRELAKVL